MDSPATLLRQSVKTLRRVVIARVEPEIDGGRFPIKRTVGERVQVRGAAILLVRKSDARGAVRFELEPPHVGVIAVRVLQSPSCPSAPAYVRITAPHRSPTYTG